MQHLKTTGARNQTQLVKCLPGKCKKLSWVSWTYVNKNWALCAPFKIPELGKEKQEISWGSHELAYWISKLQARVSSCLKKTKWTAPEEWQVRLFSACPTPTLTHVPTHSIEEREGIINPWGLLFSYNLRISKNEDIYGYLSGCLSPSLLHFIPQK